MNNKFDLGETVQTMNETSFDVTKIKKRMNADERPIR